MARVGVVGDLHLPFVHPCYLRFVKDTFRKWKVNRVVLIGDIVDAHALGFWDHSPNGMSAEDESAAAARELVAWKKAFPKAAVCIGNHDERNYRTARKAGLPDRFLRSYADVWDTPGWAWDFSHTIDGALYEHGTGTSGKDAALNRAVQKRTSLAIGHVHSYAGVKYHSNEFDRIFGINVGCGIDCRAYAFDYGKAFPVRPVLGCGIVIDGKEAHFCPMPCGEGEPYHRSKGKRK